MKTVANYLFSDMILKYGFPRILNFDNGTEFKSKLIESLLQELGIKKTYIFPTTHKLMENWNLLIDLLKIVLVNFL